MSVMRRVATVVFLLALASVAAAQAQQSPTEPRVLSASGSRSDGSAGLGDRVTVRVRNLDSLVGMAGGNCRSIVLFVSGVSVPDMGPETCDVQRGELVYLLDRDPQNDANNRAWHQLLGRPRGEIRRTALTLGTAQLAVVPTDVTRFPLHLVPRFAVAAYFVVLIVSLMLIVAVSKKTRIIRRPIAGSASPPYSLSRTLMLFWCVTVLAGFAFLWVVTGETDTLTGSVLALIGMTGGGGLAAWMMDAARESDPVVSRGFLTDALSDRDGGFSLHRVQLFAWTMILGAIFCATLFQRLFMPQFSAQVLALLGLSTSTYLGFKLNDRPSTRVGPTTLTAR